MATRTTPAENLGVIPGPPRWLASFRILERYAGALAAIAFFPPNATLLWICVVGYLARMWAVEAVYHRYFAHRGFKANRVVQFLLAVLAIQSGQRGALWWGLTHRNHHRYAETERDPHSPVAHSFFHAYSAWIMQPANQRTDLDAIADFARHPELRWLDRHYIWIFYGGAALTFLAGALGVFGPDVGGLAAMLWGVWVPSILVLQAVALVNTICHMPAFPGGYRRYETPDRSVNRPILNLFTLGAGFHNNHHRYAAVARSGFAWHEFDPTYWSLLLLERLGVISEVRRSIPGDVLAEGRLALPGTTRAG